MRDAVKPKGTTHLAGGLYTGCHDIKDISHISEIINGYQEKTDQISIKYLTDFS